MYPKEIGYILMHMGIGPGCSVIEAGTGSGSFTAALAHAVGETGRVYSYDKKEQTQQIAVRNIERLGFLGQIDFHCRDIEEGFLRKMLTLFFWMCPTPTIIYHK
jgi:tRNA (adenine57-N1/adenine58-N1)-methyltransferase